MRWTRTLASTLRENPQDAEIDSHKLMLRAGLIRKLSGGLYTFMPLGLRALRKVERIVREEMDRAGALEILMPALQPSELWEQSGRLAAMGPAMFRLKDRQDRLMALAPTHEEVVTDLMAREINSYRQLPCTVYQIQTKFRDEIRPRFGLLRAREFIMKDAYSFDASLSAADAGYRAMYDAYTRIFARCGLRAQAVEADTGDIGGKWSHEFMAPSEAGEDGIVSCPTCGYAANQERAERRPPADPSQAPECPAMAAVATPNVRTIEQVSAFLNAPPHRLIKTLIYAADDQPVAVLLAGDRELNECKLRRALGAKKLEPASERMILETTGAPAGFVGPVGLKMPIYADSGLRGASDRIAGANRTDTHVRHLVLERDARITDYMDLVVAIAGDGCPRCGDNLRQMRGIEVGHLFKLGVKYSEAFKARFLNEKGETETLVMGCYGIGVTRTLQAVIEQNRDADGILWPMAIAPYSVTILSLDPKDAGVVSIAERLASELESLGVDVLIDDRTERPGVKFKDADLLGIPLRVVVGAKSLAQGGIEVKRRAEKTGILVQADQAAQQIAAMARAALTAPHPASS